MQHCLQWNSSFRDFLTSNDEDDNFPTTGFRSGGHLGGGHLVHQHDDHDDDHIKDFPPAVDPGLKKRSSHSRTPACAL